jgi:hypothetical protein
VGTNPGVPYAHLQAVFSHLESETGSADNQIGLEVAAFRGQSDTPNLVLWFVFSRARLAYPELPSFVVFAQGLLGPAASRGLASAAQEAFQKARTLRTTDFQAYVLTEPVYSLGFSDLAQYTVALQSFEASHGQIGLSFQEYAMWFQQVRPRPGGASVEQFAQGFLLSAEAENPDAAFGAIAATASEKKPAPGVGSAGRAVTREAVEYGFSTEAEYQAWQLNPVNRAWFDLGFRQPSRAELAATLSSGDQPATPLEISGWLEQLH